MVIKVLGPVLVTSVVVGVADALIELMVTIVPGMVIVLVIV